MRYKKGNLSEAKLIGSRLIAVYIDARSPSPPTELIRDIIRRFPNENIYKQKQRRIPGQVILNPPLIYIVGQVIPREDSFESPEQRIETFLECLNHLTSLIGDNKIEIAIDRGLCPELHGDNWEEYKSALTSIEEITSIEFLVYKDE